MNENHAIVHVQLAVDLTPTNAQAALTVYRQAIQALVPTLAAATV